MRQSVHKWVPAVVRVAVAAAVAVFATALPGSPGAAASGDRLSPYLHARWQFDDGLPQNVVQAICQTRDGYLWIGTQNGLARFDGVRFVVYDSRNTPEFTHNNIGALLETKDGTLWIGTEGGGLVQLKQGRFRRFTKADGLAGDMVRCLFEASDGTLWIGTRGEKTDYIITRLKNGRLEIVPEFNESINHAARVITEDSRKNILVVSSKGFGTFRDGIVTFEERLYLRAVLVDSKGDVWLGGNGGLQRLRDKRLFTKKDGLPDNHINTLFEDSAGNLWVGTSGGLSRYTGERFIVEFNKDNNPYDAINAIVEDREKNIWVGAKDGLHRLSDRTFWSYTTAHGLSHNNVMSVLEDKDGSLWIGTWGGGLNRYKDGVFSAFTTAHGLSNDLVVAIHPASGGGLWVGSDFNGGTFHFDYEKFVPVQGPKSSRSVVQQGDQLWVATPYGLLQCSGTNYAVYREENGLPSLLVKVLLLEQSNVLWIGTAEGLCRWEGDTRKTFTTADGLASINITCLTRDSQGTLWVGTAGGGLHRYRNGRFTAYTTRNGLFTDDVWEILEDDHGFFWMSSRVGVSRVARKDLDDFDAGKLTSIPVNSYGTYDGMESIECNTVGKPSGWKTRDGRLWFTTTRGLAVVDPKTVLKVNQTPPAVVVEQMVVNGTIVPVIDQPLLLQPDQRQVEIHYTGLHFRAPQKIRFQYKLEGLDSDWVDAGTRRVAYYNNLRPGKYVFRVTACNYNNVWSPSGGMLEFSLAPHFYQTAWFYGLCALGVIFGGASLVQIRVRSLKHRERELEAIVHERTRNLEAEIAERQRIHGQLLDVSRKAGMAEVASGVLHNVGNVLNSVNVSATLVADQVRHLRCGSIEKIANLMLEQPDLPAFLNTEKGKQLPAYLKTVGQHLIEEQAKVLEEIAALRKNVDHIKDIVAMQQSLAKASGLMESVEVAELIDHAIQMSAVASFARRIEVVRELQPTGPIVIEKHKALQILINLIRNAKHACLESESAGGRIVIGVRPAGDERVRICITDTGVGIPAENLTRIFSHGFSTRKQGHGFGLHSAALAAKELGGSLSAQSEGPGKGATFILELPLDATRKAATSRSGPSPGDTANG